MGTIVAEKLHGAFCRLCRLSRSVTYAFEKEANPGIPIAMGARSLKKFVIDVPVLRRGLSTTDEAVLALLSGEAQ